MQTSDGGKKPLYCHWDSHDHDVLFMNENELDQHLYSHFSTLADPAGTEQPYPSQMVLTPESIDEASIKRENYEKQQQQTVECHWDACHEMFDIDQIMEHFRTSHMEESLHPHDTNCMKEVPAYGPNDSEQQRTLKHPHSRVQVQNKLPTSNYGPSFHYNPSQDSNEAVTSDEYVISTAPGPTNAVSTPVLDISKLPTLTTPTANSENFGCYQCMWHIDSTNRVCGEKFLTSNELNAHVVHKHIDSNFTCHWDDCSRERNPFSQRQKVVRHVQVHTRTSDFKCRVCQQQLSSETQLKAHEMRHFGERPFTCYVCNRSFRTKTSLHVHQRTHTGEKPLMCNFPGCGKCFAESSNLAKHKRTHMARQFQCGVCGRLFTRKDHLLRHAKTKNHYTPQGSVTTTNGEKPQAGLPSKMRITSGARVTPY